MIARGRCIHELHDDEDQEAEAEGCPGWWRRWTTVRYTAAPSQTPAFPTPFPLARQAGRTGPR
eukprot:1394303-Pyramimonas_sp.AAC.1